MLGPCVSNTIRKESIVYAGQQLNGTLAIWSKITTNIISNFHFLQGLESIFMLRDQNLKDLRPRPRTKLRLQKYNLKTSLESETSSFAYHF